ncbi:MAG: DUF262 domain-containing protein [Sphingomonadaceae bacterium]
MQAYPPHPSVEHLTTLFRRIQIGDIVVPAFQRAFVWGAGEMLSLLESVNAGYPIGSLLLWRADEEIFQLNKSTDIPFPESDVDLPVHYILDGLQRLSTLYGAFHYEAGKHHENFDLRYDLQRERFVRGEDALDFDPNLVSLNALFRPKRMLEIQRRIIEEGGAETTLERLTSLQARFQEYMVPIVTLGQRDLEEVVNIFERVNSTGTRLSRVDFMRAVTWSKDFDLNNAIDEVAAEIEPEGFDLDDDTIVKGLGQYFGLAPVPDSLIELRKQDPDALHDAVPKLIDDLRGVFSYLREEIGIYSDEFVPYEGQILALLKLQSKLSHGSAADRQALRSWFLKMSFEEALQGRPDHYVANLIARLHENFGTLEFELGTLNLDAKKFVRKRMLKGKAFTSAVYVMLARQGPIDLLNGAEIFPYEVTSGYDAKSIVPIFDVHEIARFTGSSISSKVPANVVLSNSNIEYYGTRYIKDWVLSLAKEPKGRQTLESHLITEPMVAAIMADDPSSFLSMRSELMLSKAVDLVLR